MKPKPKVAIHYRIIRRARGSRRRITMGRKWLVFADAMTALAGARRLFPEATLVRTTVLTEVFT